MAPTLEESHTGNDASSKKKLIINAFVESCKSPHVVLCRWWPTNILLQAAGTSHLVCGNILMTSHLASTTSSIGLIWPSCLRRQSSTASSLPMSSYVSLVSLR